MEDNDAGLSRVRGSRLLLGLLLILLAVGSVAAAVYADTSYKVQPGDTLSGIAYRYGVTVDAIMVANGLASRSTIYAGQVLTIPSSGSTPSTPPTQSPPQASPGTYVVQPGDNLITLASKYGVAREALAAANGISPSSFLYIGQVLTIPGKAQPPAPTSTPLPPTPIPSPTAASVPAQLTTTPQPVTSAPAAEAGKPIQYTVQSGDNLSSIAARFSTTVEALVDLNNLSDSNTLYAGQVLTIIKGNDQNNKPPAKTPVAKPTVPTGPFGPKWVDVNLSTQTMVAYEGQTPVYTARVSSGVYKHPTVVGTYRVYAKYRTTRMQGGEGVEHYDIPNVPYTLYFYSGYALHGAFWHNNFGHPMSHGCVNLSVNDSKWMYDWAPIGTMVVTHN